jgi:hypothetical protein
MINRRGVIFIVSLAIATAVTLIGTYYAVNWDSAADQPNHAAQPIAALAKQNSGPYFPEGGQYWPRVGPLTWQHGLVITQPEAVVMRSLACAPAGLWEEHCMIDQPDFSSYSMAGLVCFGLAMIGVASLVAVVIASFLMS